MNDAFHYGLIGMYDSLYAVFFEILTVNFSVTGEYNSKDHSRS